MKSSNPFFKCIVLAATLFAGASQALADGDTSGFVAFPSFSIRQETGIVGGNQIAYHSDLRFGYLTADGYYLGMIYESTISSGANSINQTAIGNSLGYFYGPYSFIASYYLTASHTEDAPGGSIQRIEGSGWQLDFAYTFPIGAGISLGPVLSYRSLTFKYSELNSQVSSDANAETYLYPYVGFVFVW